MVGDIERISCCNGTTIFHAIRLRRSSILKSFSEIFLTDQKTMEGGTLDPKRGVTILKTEYAADYWQRRQKVIALASYIALKTKRTRPEESDAAHGLAEALKLDRV